MVIFNKISYLSIFKIRRLYIVFFTIKVKIIQIIDIYDTKKHSFFYFNEILLEKYSNCELILENHKNFDKYIKENIDFAIYNLGYLPKGDKYITTNAKDVEESLKKLLEKLNSKGAIFITFYIGHSAGQIESLEISKFLQNLNQKEYTILKCTFENQKNNPPYVVMIQKI